MHRSKAYRDSLARIDKDALYPPREAIKLARGNAGSTKFDQTVDVAMRLGVDPRKADQIGRGTVYLPHCWCKTAWELVLAAGD
jgi:large subunit ribosomal protein L1